MPPRYPFLVIDMNTLRREELMRPLINDHALATLLGRERVGLVLPAVADWELSRGVGNTISRSFEILADRPEVLSVAQHTYVLKGLERTYRRRLRMSSIIDHRRTRAARGVLRGLRDDTHIVDPRTVDAVRAHWRELLDREEDADVLRALIGVHRQLVPRPTANAIRAGLQQRPPNRAAFVDYLAGAVGDRTDLAKFLRAVTYGSSMAKRIASFASFSLTHLLALQATALRWHVFGGHGTASDHTLENAMMDAEYATLAAYGRGFVTNDEGARDVYEAVVAVAARIWPRR